MCSYEANDHKGFCIQYKFSKEIIKKTNDDSYRHWFIKPIIYSNKRINLDISNSNTTELFATKSKNWEKEKEVRLISYNPNCDNDYDRIELDSDSKIDAIYFGYRCSDDNINLIKNILGPNVKYYKMKMDIKDIYNIKAHKI